jgi:hypothetical protein
MRRIKDHCIVKDARLGGAKFFSGADPDAPVRIYLRKSNDITKTQSEQFIGKKVAFKHQQDRSSCTKASSGRHGNMISNTCADRPREWVSRKLRKHSAPPSQGSAEAREVSRFVLRIL